MSIAQSRYRWSPATVQSPLALVAPTSMMDPQSPESGSVGEEEDYAAFRDAARRIHAGWHRDAEGSAGMVIGNIDDENCGVGVIVRRRVARPLVRPYGVPLVDLPGDDFEREGTYVVRRPVVRRPALFRR